MSQSSAFGEFTFGESPFEGPVYDNSAPVFTNENFVAALLALLPRGRVWPKTAESVQGQAVATLAPTFQRHAADLGALLADAFPPTTLNLLPEWEATLGLPDPCAGQLPTIPQRVAQVVARFISTGGQSVSYLIQFAAALGFTITITEFAPFRFGISRFGDPLCGAAWAFAFRVNAPLHSVDYFRFGISTFGEPLAAWSNDVLECEINRIKPAHTVAIFAYA